MDFESEYQRVSAITNAATRGRELEVLMLRLFKRSRFDATLNSRAAWPRQTDLFASYDEENYLVEVKWESVPAGVPEVDDLRGRLRETPPGAIGVLISLSGFTESAIVRVAAKRLEPVLLVDRDEVLRLFKQSTDLHRLLRLKSDTLMRHGSVHLGPTTAPSTGTELALPAGGRYYADLDGVALPWFVSGCEFSPLVFTPDLLGGTWSGGGEGNLAFDVRLPVHDETELAAALSTLSKFGWLHPDADWSIQQSSRNWFGSGAASFIGALTRREDRYAGLRAHHTEEVRLYSVFPGGHLTLSADLSGSRRRVARHVRLSFRLDGIPFDTAALRRLVSALNVDDAGLAYRFMSDGSINRTWIGDKAPTGQLNVVGYLLEAGSDQSLTDGDLIVVAVVVVNPFMNATNDALGELGHLVRGIEFLVCALKHQHPLRDGGRRKYHLSYAEFAATNDSYVTRFSVDW